MVKKILSVSSSFLLQHLKLEDMNPTEEFEAGCQVYVKGSGGDFAGIIKLLDADGRMALVEWGTGHCGWWYLKDLTRSIIPPALAKRRGRVA